MKASINGAYVHICFSKVSKSTMISIIWQTELWFTNYRVRRTRSAIFCRCTIFLFTQIRFDSNPDIRYQVPVPVPGYGYPGTRTRIRIRVSATRVPGYPGTRVSGYTRTSIRIAGYPVLSTWSTRRYPRNIVPRSSPGSSIHH